MKSLTKGAAAALLVVATGVAFAPPASANAAYSSKQYYPNGASLQAYAYIDSKANTQGCGQYQASNVITKTPSWINVNARFTEDGLGSVTVGGVTGTRTGSDVTITWKNTNGARGAYLSGNACLSWASWYMHLQVSGASLQNGSVRTVTTRQL